MIAKIKRCIRKLKMHLIPGYTKYVELEEFKKKKTFLDLMSKDNLLEETSLISKTDKHGTIYYVNEKFLDITGFTLDEIVGCNHNIINSGYHPNQFWKQMYETVAEHKIWHHPCIINKNKSGELFYIKLWVQAEFNMNGDLKGYICIMHDITELTKNHIELEKKNTYLEYAAKILRHDMHSGINTYIPRGIVSLKRRLNKEITDKYSLYSPIRLLEEGLTHTQKVYRGVYEFTNLVKSSGKLTTAKFNLKDILEDHLKGTNYGHDVHIEPLPSLNVNDALFCTAIDNFIRNGLKYNDSKTKYVKIYADKSSIYVEDNGRGMSYKDLQRLSKPYTRNQNQKEPGTGLGLNIALAILQEHKFTVKCTKNKQGGTTFTVKYST